MCFPHSLAYFNELVGGPSQGHKYLSGTNIDWGHNVFFLRDELKRRGWESLGTSLWTRYDLKIAGIDAELTTIPILRKSAKDRDVRFDDVKSVLQPGRYAISVCIVQGTMGVPSGTKKGDDIDNGFMYFREFKPIGHVGYSIWLYELSEEDILRSKSWGAIYKSRISRDSNAFTNAHRPSGEMSHEGRDEHEDGFR